MECIEKFAELYRRDPEDVAFCPYRVCPMGAHSDHQLGKITGFAIDKGIHIAYGVKKNGVVTVDAQDKILRMTEKVPDPETHWVSVAFYYYPREAAGLIQQALAEGCGADAPGSFLSWVSRRMDTYAMQMPGRCFDVGNLESYQTIRETYQGITCGVRGDTN